MFSGGAVRNRGSGMRNGCMTVPSTNTTRTPVSQVTTYELPAATKGTPPPAAPGPGAAVETIIQPSKGWIGVNWGELFRSRELLYFLIWRDIKVRYKQAVLGAAWAIIQPLFNMVLYTLVFGGAAGFKHRLGEHATL